MLDHDPIASDWATQTAVVAHLSIHVESNLLVIEPERDLTSEARTWVLEALVQESLEVGDQTWVVA